MAYGVSFSISPGIRIYSSSRGSVAFAMFLGAIYLYLWFFVAIAYMVGLIAGTLAVAVIFLARHSMTKEKVSKLQVSAIEPSSIKVVGRLTEPPTWGVYRVASTGKPKSQYRLGNHPVRQQELVREFGSAELILLFRSRQEAEELKSLLASGRITPVTAPSAG